MDLEIILLSEISQTKTNFILLMHGIKKNDTNEFIYRTETTHRHKKQTHDYHRGMQGRGIN